MKKRYLIIGAIIIGLAITFFVWDSAGEEANDILVSAKRGKFEISVNTTGELDPVKSVSIRGPGNLYNSGIREFKINKLVPEGTVVSEGDFIAELDRSELYNKLTEATDQLTKEQAQFTQTQLDTALTLREARDQIQNLEFSVEEKKIVLEQSQFEPPATIKQAEIELQKAFRDLSQAQQNYEIKVEQSKAKMTEASINLSKKQGDVNFMKNLLESFRITAPQSGMVIYAKNWDGKKIREGNTVSAWNPVVATLPDLSQMISKTYVNEVDIMKIKKGQMTLIGLDAFPEKRLTGEVIEVANVGEQKPNSDAKVFEVSIMVNESDTSLRPAMTTSNLIISETISEAIYVPLEALRNQGDSINFVFKKEGLARSKQEVVVGKTNDNEAIILSGIKEGETIYLSTPNGLEEMEVTRLDKTEKEQVATKGP